MAEPPNHGSPRAGGRRAMSASTIPEDTSRRPGDGGGGGMMTRRSSQPAQPPPQPQPQQFGRGGVYPASARLTFIPGGISYSTHAATIGSGNENATATDAAMKVRIATEQPATLIQQARRADDALRLHSLWTAAAGSFGISSESLEPVPTAATATTTTKEEEPDKQTKQQQQVIDATPHFLPSLSVLAEAVLGRLTGCPADQAKGWADAMVLSQYHYEENHTAATGTGTGTTEDCQPQQQKERIPLSEDDLLQQQSELLSNRPASNKNESSQPPKSGRVGGDASVVALLKRLLLESERQAAKGQSGGGTADGGGGTGFRPVQRRPCGYVFKRGDIAWNCRTCQTDQTCVICDECFRGSNHDGHEVYFHRTTPGGCCDCGDAEAWHVEGCCNVHRPSEPTTTTTAATHQALLQPAVPSSSTSNNNNNCSSGETMMTNDDAPSLELTMDDPMEAVHAAATARQWAVETMTTDPVTRLPPRLLSALGVVMGAAVQCVMDTVDGAGVGADAIQWTKRWSDEAAAIVNAAPHNEDYWDYYGNQQPYNSSSPTMIVESTTLPPATLQTYAISNKIFPENYRLHLRLHNDDVHTFEEVIEALHEPRQMRPDVVPLSGDTEQQPHQLFPSLVSLRENATEMTHRVDADGQVTVKTYSNVASAMRGFRRLKSCGLHCAVVSTAQVDAEHRARAICVWLTEIAAAHPAAQALLVHALVQLPGRNNPSDDDDLGGIYTWHPARMIAPWASLAVTSDNIPMKLRQRFDTFPPHLASSYVTREEAELLHGMALAELQSIPTAIDNFVQVSGTVPDFYSLVPYRLPSKRYHKSPHALWGTLPSEYSDPLPTQCKHPLLDRLLSGTTQPHPAVMNRLTESVYVVDTDLRKQQVGERVTSSVFPHKLHGMNMISGVGMTHVKEIDARRPPLPSPMDLRHLLATSSFRAPLSPLLLLMLLDPYPTKQLRGAIHALFLSLLTNGRFKSRFAGAMAIAYRPLSTLFCTGVGTEADTPLHFTVQIFTAGSLVRALGHGPSTELLLLSDQSATASLDERSQTSIGVFVPPIAHVIVRCIHTNLLGATKEVNMILKNTVSANDDNSQDDGLHVGSIALLPSLTYVAGEHPSMTPLPAAPDDGFLDSRSTRHKRLPHLLRDLDYVIETPGTALRLLLPSRFPVYQGPSFSSRGEDVLTFSCVFARMLRLAQGMDPQKRKISGGHVEYEQNRWLEAFGLSLNFGGTRDALAECPCGAASAAILAGTGMGDDSHMQLLREAVGNIIASLLREIKLWLYREGLLETGLPIPSGGANSAMDLAQVEALQRSTLHVSTSYLGNESSSMSDLLQNSSNSVALSCATGVKMTEAQLTLIENALKLEAAQRLEQQSLFFTGDVLKQLPSAGPVIGDWLRVPHAPLAGDSLSFHLPLHRALAKCVKCICSVVIPEQVVASNPDGWWKIPVLDDTQSSGSYSDLKCLPRNPLVPLIRTTLRSSNCRVVWSAGPDCTPQEAQRRRSRSRSVSASIAVAKVIHSLADHPIRCLAAAQQIERHLWARNGTSVAGMAMNYLSAPLCRTFRDLDLLLVQLSASGMSCGLGARRIFSLLLSRFSLDGYLCDPERRSQASHMSTNSFSSTMSMWVNPPRLQDADHAVILAESFFTTLCILVTELPLLPPNSLTDDIPLRSSIRRELLHALAAEPRSHSEAMTAAAVGISRREENEGTVGKGGSGGLFRAAFSAVLREIGKQKLQSSSRASSSPPAFELKAEYCDEYDPTFFHLRRPEHQHAMDIVARLRKQKLGNNREALDVCLPIVCAPPKAHPRFLPCRLLLHLDCMDASLRRALLFALTNGSWIPPPEPLLKSDSGDEEGADSTGTSKVTKITRSSSLLAGSDVPPTTTFNRRLYKAQSSSGSFSKRSGTYDRALFNSDVVATSSVSFLEVLQLLTLQVHTLEECASLHRLCPDLDDEGRLLSSSLSINSYLSRLVFVPESLVDVWALRPHPHGPLKSRGSGDNRGSILGLLIALYEHRADHGASTDDDSGENGQGVDDHGGARSLASSGLKWLLRFINALVDGASSVGAAVKSAKMGIPLRVASVSDSGSVSWTIGEHLRSNILEMLDNLPDLWPTQKTEPFSPEKGNAKNKEARKAAQQRVMEMMKLKQAAFAATISSDTVVKGSNDDPVTEVDLCIICRCDDTDGDNNGPLGYLGHVQRSRMLQMRSMGESFERDKGKQALVNSYRVVGHMGCQLRETESMDSMPLACLPKGSVVSVLQSKVSTRYDILARRILVRHVSKNLVTNSEIVSEGWASVQSSQGYVILSPLVALCYNNTRWGSSRPIVKQCGHAAHLKCVETHTLSLHHRAAGDQPYDGRFAANINDGEFLCPLCKQLSNILIPRDGMSAISTIEASNSVDVSTRQPIRSIRNLLSRARSVSLSPIERRALEDFGSHLYAAMCVSWERVTIAQKATQERWHTAIKLWDYEESDSLSKSTDKIGVKNILRLFRQQLIAWAAVGHSAAALEASARGLEDALPFGIVSSTFDPWLEYGDDSYMTHPMLLELKRTLTGCAGLYEVLTIELSQLLAGREMNSDERTVVGSSIANILEGKSWLLDSEVETSTKSGSTELWAELNALISAIPSHVARDGSITSRCEARATAAAMWAVKGLGCDATSKTEPPAPLVIKQLFASDHLKFPAIPPKWGTLDPFVTVSDEMHHVPFRLGVACGFLYTPLLAWDLCTFTGSALSCVLSNSDAELPNSGELLQLAHTLLIGRIIQAIITPHGIDIPHEDDLDGEECWTASDAAAEGLALTRLVAHCRGMVQAKALALPHSLLGSSDTLSPLSLLAGVGRAILPFSRSLVLMLRACFAAIHDRQEKMSTDAKSSEKDATFHRVLCNKEIMTFEDGFQIVNAFACPKPSELLNGDWFILVNRWLVASIGFEVHHCSMDRSMTDSDLVSSNPSIVSTSMKRPFEVDQVTNEQPLSDESLDEMVVDIDLTNDDGDDRILAIRNARNEYLGHGDIDDSDDELADSVDEAEEMIGFDNGIGPLFGSNPVEASPTETGESSDMSSASPTYQIALEGEFANVGQSPILPFQPTLLGSIGIGPGRQGSAFEFSNANELMSDMSHLGLVHRKEIPTFTLIRLPQSFVELYNIVNKVKGRDDHGAIDESDDVGSAETAICLLTGAVMRSGSSRRFLSRANPRLPGACTLHARKTASGVGIFFLVQKCTVLLMHNSKSAYSPSLYVDEHGEEDPQLRRGRPLFLNEARYRALEQLWRQQGIPREVAQIRSTSDRVIRDNWY